MEDKKILKRRLNSSREVRRYLSDIAYRLELGELGIAKSNALRGICGTILMALKNEDIEERLEELERFKDSLLKDKEV